MKKITLFSIGFIVTFGWLATGVSWAAPPFAVPAKGGLPACKAELAVCTGDLDSCDLAYDTCTKNLTTCDTDLGTCNTELSETTAELTQCESDLATCEATAQAFPATGQVSCWESFNNPIDCAGTGHDGDIKAGAELSYTETTYTVIDNNTQLEWMKQDSNDMACDSLPGSLSIHCQFTWDEAFAFVANLNANNHGGHDDWRVPNAKELQSIVNYENRRPAVSAEFNTGCVAGCTVETCSCTYDTALYWSSTSMAWAPDNAAAVVFDGGAVTNEHKNWIHRVRAVRGGL